MLQGFGLKISLKNFENNLKKVLVYFKNALPGILEQQIARIKSVMVVGMYKGPPS